VRIGEEPYKVPPSDRVLNDFFPPMDTGQTTDPPILFLI
jgi:hypothetical protein